MFSFGWQNAYFYGGFNPYNPFMRRCNCGNPFNTLMQFSILSNMMNNLFRKPVYKPDYTYQMPLFASYQPQYPTNLYQSVFNSYNNTPIYQAPSYDYSRLFESAYSNNIFVKDTKTSDNKRTSATRSEVQDKPVLSSKKTEKTNVKTNTPSAAKNLGPEFLNKVKHVAQSLNCDYKDLLAVMNAESGINPGIWNGKVAVGLIQFTQSSVNELNRVYKMGLTLDKVSKMSAMEQLDLTEKYLKIAKGYQFPENYRLSARDLYAIVFLPGRANREILCIKGEKDSNGRLLNFYEGNASLDYDRNGNITKNELGRRVNENRVNESVFA